MQRHEPDFTRVVDAAWNRESDTIPLYEHAISAAVQSALLDRDLRPLLAGDDRDQEEAFRISSRFLASLGYDVYAFEGCITELVQGGQGLMGRAGPIIRDAHDLAAYPWDELPGRYFDRFGPSFRALERALPAGMKAVAGVGNGPFEIAQDFVPLTDLAYMEVDDPQTFAGLWRSIGEAMYAIWDQFLKSYGDTFCVCRVGDDFGFKTSLLMRPDTLRGHILPVYKRIVKLVHAYGKPFLLHSCGAIWEVMDDLIDEVGIDAKHSNEDAIAPFSRWLELYGERIGTFGGVDMNVLCEEDGGGIRAYVREVLESTRGHRGVAIGSGNQIADYVPPEGFIAMVETVREFRGDA
ncbi:MAG: uroporphyrinogen decarboxylase family protein [Spirochaetota bacterium]